MECPECHEKMQKWGTRGTRRGEVQRYRCPVCGRVITKERRPQSLDEKDWQRFLPVTLLKSNIDFRVLLEIRRKGPIRPTQIVENLDYWSPEICEEDIVHIDAILFSLNDKQLAGIARTVNDYEYWHLLKRGHEFFKKSREFSRIGGKRSQKLARLYWERIAKAQSPPFCTVAKQGNIAPDLIVYFDEGLPVAVEVETSVESNEDQVIENLEKHPGLGFEASLILTFEEDKSAVKRLVKSSSRSDVDIWTPKSPGYFGNSICQKLKEF